MGNRAGSSPVIPTKESIIEFMIDIIIIITIILTLLSLLFLWFLHYIFSMRQNNNPLLKYFTAKDFPYLEADPVTFKSAKQVTLKGFFYYYDRPEKHLGLIILPHGIGAGHHAYMHLIEVFCHQGYIVFSYDNTGCELSEGKGIKGVPQSIIDLKYAMAYLSKTVYKDYLISVVGHSWGGYAALRSGLFSLPIHRIIALAPLNNPLTLLSSISPIMKIFVPIIWLYHYINFGKIGVQTSANVLAKTKVKTLVIQGKKDEMIPIGKHYQQLVASSKNNPYVTLSLNDHRHNPYLTFEAENYVLDDILKGVQKYRNSKDEGQRKTFANQIDYSKVGNHDQDVMNLMFEFLL